MDQSLVLMVLFIIGSLILLLSWIFQNYFSKNWEGQIADSKERMSIITIYAARHDLYSFQLHLFQSIAIENSNEKAIKNLIESFQQYLVNFVEMQTQIQYNLALDKEKYSKGFSTAAQEKETARVNEINKRTASSDLSGLFDLADEYINEINGTFDPQANEIMDFLDKMSKKKKRSNNIYLVTYIIGTVILAVVATLKFVIPATK